MYTKQRLVSVFKRNKPVNIPELLSYLGTFVFAITGAMKARAHRMDLVGGLVLAFVTAYGGGTLRDLIIGIRPVNWLNDDLPLLLVLIAATFTFLLRDNLLLFRRFIFYTDAVGLGLFTAAGMEVAFRHGLSPAYALLMGVISATFGGLVADVLCSTIPSLLKKGEFYFTSCVLGGACYLILRYMGSSQTLMLTVCVVVVVGSRLISKRKRLYLPEI